MSAPEHIAGHTVHARHGGVRHSFRYSVDYVLIDPEISEECKTRVHPRLFSRNRFNLFSVRDRDHGGARGAGQGALWARETLADAGLAEGYALRLMTQPAFLGYAFNPVSFWLALAGDDLLAVIAEVNNTFGDRHNYLCHLPDFAPITPHDIISATKVFHVSPFQDIAGGYRFSFMLRSDRITIRILHDNGKEGLVAKLTGKRRPLTNRSILWAAIRRPFGALRVVGLIYLQALRLKLKGARYRPRPEPPYDDLSAPVSQGAPQSNLPSKEAQP